MFKFSNKLGYIRFNYSDLSSLEGREDLIKLGHKFKTPTQNYQAHSLLVQWILPQSQTEVGLFVSSW